MKLFRILLAAILVVATVAPLASCSYDLGGTGGLSIQAAVTETATEDEGGSSAKEKTPKHNLYENETNIRILNQRCVWTEEGELATDWGGSGFEACINVAEGGSSLSVESRSNHSTEWKVYLDGEVVIERVKLGSGRKTTLLMEYVSEGLHTVRLVKEGQISSNTSHYNSLVSLSFFGEIVPTETEKDLYVEFLGDAMFVGYGVLGTEKGSAEIDSETSATAAIPYLVGEMLDADYACAAHSGVGLASKVAGLVASTMFSTQLGWRDRDVRFYTPTRTPDAVVIYMGEDDTYSGLTVGEFVRQAEILVTTIRDLYGEDVPVIWAYGIRFLTWREGELNALATKLGEDSNFYLCELNYGVSGANANSATERYPNQKECIDNAMVLSNYLSELLNGETILEDLQAEWAVEADDVAEEITE